MTRLTLPTLALAAVALMALPAPVEAEPAGPGDSGVHPVLDAGWTAWIGCWEPTDLADDENGAELLVCFAPTDGGVEVLTYSEGEVVGEERIIADGQPVPAADGGCEGTREAHWSADRKRAFILSDLECTEGVYRTTRGVFAMADEGREWIEIHGVRSAEREQAMAVRAFRAASQRTLARHEVSAPGAERELAIRTSRLHASGALDEGALVEAVDRVGAEVTAALVAEVAEPYTLDARALQRYSAAGVPDEVIDMMVAVSYPDRFVVDAGEARPAPARAAAQQAYPPSPYYYGATTRCRSWDRYCWDPVYRDMLWYYGAPGYAFGGRSGWGYRGPRYIVVPGTVRGSGGSVSPTQGFRAPRSQVRPAQPSETRPSQGMPSQTRPAQTRPASGSSSGSSGQARPTRSSPPPTSGGRVNPTTGHSSGGGDTRPTRSSGGGGDGDTRPARSTGGGGDG